MVGYGISRLLGGSNGGGPPDIDRDSAGTHAGEAELLLAQRCLAAALDARELAWLYRRLGFAELVGATDLVIAISIGGDFACEAMNAALRLDTPSSRAFLGPFVELP